MSRLLDSCAGLVVVGNASEDPFAIDLAYAMGQVVDVADLISLKTFANGEFCPRFISDEVTFDRIGHELDGRTVAIVSTTLADAHATGARDAHVAHCSCGEGKRVEQVVLVEPDLFFSAQDRGARRGLGQPDGERSVQDLKKFDGQPFSAGLYAELLEVSGVDRVITVHNHSHSVERLYAERFGDRFHNLVPTELYADYLRQSDIVDFERDGCRLALCAPDEGARANSSKGSSMSLACPNARFVLMQKERSGEREVAMRLHPESGATLADLEGRDVVLLDDMVRTGSTVVQACEHLRAATAPRRLRRFALLRLGRGRQKMASSALDEILTMNTLPTVLNRDVQGRLRRKMVVLKIERWLAQKLTGILGLSTAQDTGGLYQIDMSSKNPRFRRKIWSSEELPSLRQESLLD